jgi:hypothetical protein
VDQTHSRPPPNAGDGGGQLIEGLLLRGSGATVHGRRVRDLGG